MQVRRAGSAGLGVLCVAAVGVAAVLPLTGPLGLPVPDAVPDAVALRAPTGGGLLLVRHAGTGPVTVDTTELTGPRLRGWWYDRATGTTVDAGSVPRDRAVALFPPDTGDGAVHDWTLVVVDATRGLVPPA